LLNIDDIDIYRVCGLLSLPVKAFHGDDGRDPRSVVLKSMDTLDVEACPGSGKTTLLVAKLALLASNWPHRTRGVCVLSHTNAARDEIEERLGSTEEGQSLLKYPHFIGTIHGFVNEFISIPWLRSAGWTPKVIDDDYVLNMRWKSLPEWVQDQILRSPSYKDYPQGALKIISSSFDISPINIGRNNMIDSRKAAYKLISKVCETSSMNGYFCFDEMFVWAREALIKRPDIREILRRRFPFLFIDEVQDNSDEQSDILYRIFMEGGDPVTRQRFGDSNQAIYGRSGVVGASVDKFPSDVPGVKKELPNSHRFGPVIASLANYFTLYEIESGLKGNGPNTRRASKKELNHTIFLFDDKTVEDVIPAYAKHIEEQFQYDKDALKNGDFVAVGAVHNTPKGKVQPAPHFVGHYFKDYSPQQLKRSAPPNSFAGYIHRGMVSTSLTGNVSHLVEGFSGAIIKAVDLSDGDISQRHIRGHNYINQLLSSDHEALNIYCELVVGLIESKLSLSKDSWLSIEGNIKRVILSLLDGLPLLNATQEFLSWPDIFGSALSLEDGDISNVYLHQAEKETVSVRLGSIHSVKGQSHTATLILDTYKRTYHLKKLKDWILCKEKTEKQREDQSDRLKLHYVGMTRPTHLLCLAMRKDSFNKKELSRLIDETPWSVKVV
jgi:superfamily I DNA/RNA helicase